MKSYKTILSISMILIMAACKPHYQESIISENAAFTTVRVEPVAIKDTPIPITASGILASKAETRLSFKIGGIIRDIKVEEGQQVRQGQVLATLDLSEISAQVTQARNAADKAARDLSRIRNLYRDSVATLEQLQDLQTLHEVAQADLRIAGFNHKYARITAPFNGKVLKRFAEEGELINPGMPVFMVGNHHQSSYVMRVSVADRDIVRLALEDSAQLFFDAYPQLAFRAQITELAEAADPRTGTFEVELTVQHPPRPLKNGFVGKAQIFPSTQPPYYQISMSALVEGDQQQAKIFTYQQTTGQAQLTEVKPHHIKSEYFTVLAEGQPPFTHVITEGAPYLQNGQQVTPITTQP